MRNFQYLFQRRMNILFKLTKLPDGQRSTIGLVVCVFALTILATTWRFWPWIPHVFAGDDLGSFIAFKDGQFASSIHQALSAAYFEKYRPVFALMMFVFSTLFGKNIVAYWIIGVLIQSINATLVCLIALRISHNKWFISCVIALAVATSRFALYQVVQITGLVEGMALIFFLLTLYFILRADESTKSAYSWSWLAVIAAFLALNTHERYIVLMPWLIGTIFLLSNIRLLSWTRKIVLISATIIALLANVLFKKIVLHVPFFVGTGGSLISIDPHSILSLATQAVFSIFGFNFGPEYLTGIQIFSLHWFPAWILAAALALCWLYTFTKGLYFAQHGYSKIYSIWKSFRWPFLLIALIVLLLLPPVLTTHLEQRWLVEPFILILLLFVWAVDLINHRSQVLAIGLTLVIGLSSITLDSIIAQHFGGIFFEASSRFSDAVKHDIVDKYPTQKTPIAFIANKAYCHWVLQNGEFFRVYGGTSRKIYCFDTLEESLSSTLPTTTSIYKANDLYTTPHFTKITINRNMGK